jgi:hypothetical protein
MTEGGGELKLIWWEIVQQNFGLFNRRRMNEIPPASDFRHPLPAILPLSNQRKGETTRAEGIDEEDRGEGASLL